MKWNLENGELGRISESERVGVTEVKQKNA
jgi:hypothetical protein